LPEARIFASASRLGKKLAEHRGVVGGMEKLVEEKGRGRIFVEQ